MLVRVIICSAVILTIVTGRVKSGDFEEDEDDEDHFGMASEATYLRDDFYRKRRSQEEGFYHTLLSRSEPQHVFKRSHGTEDFEHNNAKFITERDWTGSSKISDADRKELETLFSKLNADDSDTKNDVTRSIADDEGVTPLDNAAYKYSAWLMAQPANKIAAALTQKAQVDNRLTRLFFDKRGLDLLLPNQEPIVNQRKSIIKKAHNTRNGPRPQANIAGLQNSTAKHLIMSGPRLCTDDSSKCLCTRACYPNIAVSVSPCKCEGTSKAASTLTQRSPVNSATSGEVAGKGQITSARSAAMIGNVATFPPQAPAVAKTEYSPQSPVATKSLINVKQHNAAVPHLVNGSTASMVTTAIKTPQVTSSVATTNASVKSDVSIISAPAPKLIKAENTTSAEPAESKSIEPIRSARQRLRQAETPVIESVVPANESQGLFGSNAPIYITHPSYQGCFKDRKPVRDLPKRFTRFDTTPESCIMECKYQNYKFAGVQYGYLCFCGNAYGRYGRVADKDCNSFCNGDPKRKCGAFWHNSVYSVDGKPYDPGLFDFAKVDEEERIHDQLSPPAVKLAKKSSTKIETHINIQGANAATHLMDAAQATLKAAKKLLPGVSKKHKIGKDGKRGKRADDQDDEELMYQRENALSSLKAAHQILQKTNFEKAKRSAEKEKRSINEDFDPYDPDDGKDLLKAYMSSVDAYNRQTRSVDDEEEDDNTIGKDNFQYRRLSEADLEEGQFVDKYDDNIEAQGNTDTYTAKKRSSEKEVLSSSSGEGEKKKRSAPNEQGTLAQKKGSKTAEQKRSVPSASEKEETIQRSKSTGPSKRAVAEPIEQKMVEPLVKDDHVAQTAKRSVQQNVESQEVNTPLKEQAPSSRIKKRNLPETNHIRSSEARAPAHEMRTRDISSTAYGSGGAENKRKRSVSESVQKVHEGSGGGYKKKRSISEPVQKIHEGSGGGYKKKRSTSESIQKVHEGSGGGFKKKRSISASIQKVHEGSGGGYKKKRSISEPIQKVHEESGGGYKKKRSISESIQMVHEGSGGGYKKKRSISESIQMVHEGSGGGYKKKRSISESIQKVHEGSGGGYKKKRSVSESVQKLHAGSGSGNKKRRSVREPVQLIHESRGENNKKRRSLNEPLQTVHGSNKQRRSLNDKSHTFVSDWYTDIQENKLNERSRKNLADANEPLQTFPVFNAESASIVKTKRDLSSQNRKGVKRKKVQKAKVIGQLGERRQITSENHQTDTSNDKNIPWDKKRRSVVEQYNFVPMSQSESVYDASNKDQISRSRRELPVNNLSDGALKMAARSDDINDIEKSLQRLESIEKRDKIATSEENVESESESGVGEHDSADDSSGDENKKLTNDAAEKKTVNKRSAENEKAADVKKSKIGKESKDSADDIKLKSDVERGVDSLLNLVVELYKQQKTIKNFENSVRTLRHDILKELNIPSKDKHAATKKVRNAIQSAAKERLHTLTSSIEHKITEFAKRHPESVKQAKLATSLLPRIPLNDKKLVESKREISRRAAEFDNIEDGFEESAQLPVPNILKEHFKRNAERDIEDFEPMKESAEQENGDLHLKKRSAERDVEERKPKKRSSEEDFENVQPKKVNAKADAGIQMTKRSLDKEVRQTEINGEKTLSRMHRDVSESEEEGLYDDDPNEDYEKLFK